jgi:hypothetical protein
MAAQRCPPCRDKGKDLFSENRHGITVKRRKYTPKERHLAEKRVYPCRLNQNPLRFRKKNRILEYTVTFSPFK